jgi:hypothetical protein
MATFQYVVFKQGADIHVFWPHYFAAYFALGMGALAASIAPAIDGVARAFHFGRARPALGGVAALAILLVPLAAVARDGVPALRYARETGGRFNEKGLLIDSDGDKTEFLRWLVPTVPAHVIIDLHEGMRATWGQTWALGGHIVSANRAVPRGPANDGRDVYLADGRFLSDDAQELLASGFHATIVGPFWRIVRSEAPGPIDAFSFVEREPNPLERYFMMGTEPQRTIAADPFATWELRVHFGQAAEFPRDAPRTLEQKRIAHNFAIRSGDQRAAAALLTEIEGELRIIHAGFDDGTEIIGTTYRSGARSLLTIYLRAAGPLASDVQLGVRSEVVARAPLSTTMADPAKREVGLPLAISPSRWRPGFVYSDPVPIRKRPGTEVFRAYFSSRGKGAPKRAAGGPNAVEVLRL